MLLPVFAYVVCASLGLMHDTVGAQELPRTVKVLKEILRQLTNDDQVKEFTELGHKVGEDNFVAIPIDLNRDGQPELVIHGINDICGAANCVHWIFRKTARGYQMILSAGSIQDVEPQKRSTNGYQDVIASMHGSAWDSDLTLYKFDGKRYHRASCFTRTYRYKDRRGNFHETKRPIISPVRCDPEQ